MMNKTQLAQLKALIDSNSLTGTDVEVAAALNAKTVMRYRGLSSAELNGWAAAFRAAGIRKTIFQASEDYNDANYEICAAARFAMENTQELLDMDNADIRTLVGELPILQAAKDALLTLAEQPISLAAEAGLPEIKDGYVYAARLLP